MKPSINLGLISVEDGHLKWRGHGCVCKEREIPECSTKRKHHSQDQSSIDALPRLPQKYLKHNFLASYQSTGLLW